jgi:hypothetical protein
VDERTFWALIESFDWSRTGDDEAVVGPAVSTLSALPVEEIQAFDEILARSLHALDTEAHARNIGEHAYTGPGDGFSVDWFLYSRCVVVANGRTYYETVLSDPSAMPQDMEFESLLYVAREAFERKTGEEYDFDPSVSYETFSNERGWRSA